MNAYEQVKSAIENLSISLSLLDNLGLALTAGHVSGALDCLRSEMLLVSWEATLELDFHSLDAMIDQAYSPKNHGALSFLS